MKLQLLWPLLLLPLPLLVWRLLPAAKAQRAALYTPFLPRLRSLARAETVTSTPPRLRMLLAWILWLALLLACCRPVLLGDPVEISTSGRDLLLAVDISGSMDERDMILERRPIRRIDMVKHVLSEFIERRRGDRIGLVLFGDHAYLQAPLTYDTETVKQLLLEAQLGFAGQKTAIGDAIGVSLKRLLERPAQSRTLILLTDGVNNAGSVSPLEAGALAAEQGVKIYTIGIGSEQHRRGSMFGQSLRRNLAADLDERKLKKIAQQSNGKYFRATSPEQLESIYRTLDQLEPVEQAAQSFRPVKELFYWPLGVALIIALTALAWPLLSRAMPLAARKVPS